MSLAYAPDANPVRTPAELAVPVRWRSGRVVEIRYTPAAQTRYATHTLFGPEPLEVGREILSQAGAHVRQVRVKGYETGVVAVIRHMPLDTPPALEPGTVQIVAYVMGVTQDELATAFAVIAAEAPPLQ